MNKFLDWMDRNRRSIGYTVGGLNLLAAVNFAAQGYYGMTLVWLVIGFGLIWDGYSSKQKSSD